MADGQVYRAGGRAATIPHVLEPTKSKGGEQRYRCPLCQGRNLVIKKGTKRDQIFKCWDGCDSGEITKHFKSNGHWDEVVEVASGANGRRAQVELSDDEATKYAKVIYDAGSKDLSAVGYFAARGIAKVPSCVRFLARAKAVDNEMPEKYHHQGYPATVVPIHRAGKFSGCQVTYLSKELDSKAPMDRDRVRVSRGVLKGGYIPLWDGEFDPRSPLVIGEGLETTLSAMELCGVRQGIATAGTSGLANIRPPKAKEYIIAGDHDPVDEKTGQRPGERSALALADRLASDGARVRVAMAPDLDDKYDWNDAARDLVGKKGKERAEYAATLRAMLLEAPVHKVRDDLTAADGDDNEKSREDDATVVDRLARLSLADYDRQRDEAAEDLGIRVGTLDRLVKDRREELVLASGGTNGAGVVVPWEQVVEPWDKPIKGDRLLDRIYSTLDTYIAMDENERVAVTLWVAHSWCLDAALHNPFLHIWSPVKGCGKSTLLTILSRMVPRPLFTSNVTASSVFRIADARSPTMLVDEADTFMKENEGLRGVLNAAHSREGAFVTRTVGEGADLTTKVFKVWVPIAIAGIGKIHPTLEDRSVSIQLQRQNKGEEKEQIPRESNGTADLKRKCAKWAQDHLPELTKAQPVVPSELRNRSRDNWWSLLAIADAAGGEWPERARKAAVQLVRRADRDDEDFKAMLLEDMRYVFNRKNTDCLSSADLVKWLVEEPELEGRPWKEFSRGKPITTTALARMLKPFGVKPRKSSQGGRPMSYFRQGALQRAFDRFLPPLPSKKVGLFDRPRPRA